jgi:hypothetical protein
MPGLKFLKFIFIIIIYLVFEIELRASHMLILLSTTELYLSAKSICIFKYVLFV